MLTTRGLPEFGAEVIQSTYQGYIATMQRQGYETFLVIDDAIMGYPKKLLA